MGILDRKNDIGSNGFAPSYAPRVPVGFLIVAALFSMAALAQDEEFGGDAPTEVSTDAEETSAEAAQEEEKISPDAPETYTIQPGDTLWNLSAKFLNNPWYWPKVWSINPHAAV